MKRKLYPRTQGAVVGVASSEVLGPNPNRHSLILSGNNAARVTFDLGGPAVLDQGITLQAGGQPIILTAADFG